VKPQLQSVERQALLFQVCFPPYSEAKEDKSPFGTNNVTFTWSQLPSSAAYEYWGLMGLSYPPHG
jgi:hypothetical protein